MSMCGQPVIGSAASERQATLPAVHRERALEDEGHQLERQHVAVAAGVGGGGDDRGVAAVGRLWPASSRPSQLQLTGPASNDCVIDAGAHHVAVASRMRQRRLAGSVSVSDCLLTWARASPSVG